jgi:hypothetical protein
MYVVTMHYPHNIASKEWTRSRYREFALALMYRCRNDRTYKAMGVWFTMEVV